MTQRAGQDRTAKPARVQSPPPPTQRELVIKSLLLCPDSPSKDGPA